MAAGIETEPANGGKAMSGFSRRDFYRGYYIGLPVGAFLGVVLTLILS